ncbi:MAG: TonB-dependent receptor [Rhodanobacteraceae bacterium]
MLRTSLQRKALCTAIVAACLSSVVAAPTFAQDTGNAGQKADKVKTLGTTVVTAQKREQILQDVPISVTVLNSQTLQDTGVHDIKDLQVLVPGLTVSSTQSAVNTVARLRGVGTVGDNPGLESSVGVVIDGVYRPRNGVGFGDLGQIERIEVLKGPQGTVFGKNTSAGVINIITRKPDFGTEADGELTVGNYGALGVAGSFNTALGDSTAFRIHASKRKRDGFMDVKTGAGPRTKHDDYDQNYDFLRAQLLVEPTDNVSIRFIGDYSKRDENCCTAVAIAREPTPGLPYNAPTAVLNALVGGNAVSPEVDPFARVAYSNRSTAQKINDKGISAEVNWNTAWPGTPTLTSITSLRKWDAVNGLDFDFSTADILYRKADKNESYTGFDTFSQEFRLTGSSGSFDWMVGAFYADESLDRNDSYRIGNAYEPYLSSLVGGQVLGGLAAQLAPLGITVDTSNPATFLSQVSGQPFGTNFAGLGALDTYRQSSTSYALFSNNTWHATDRFDLTMGLRYTHESKNLDSRYSNPNGSTGCASTLADVSSRVAAALIARGIPIASLPPELQQQILGGVAPQVAGYMCLPWANALHNGRVTEQSRDESEWSGTLKGAWRWNDQLMTYVSAARGYKAGGFNLDRVQSSDGLSSGTAGITPVNDTSFPGEFVDSYELGARSTLADGNLLLNATLFYQRYSDFQLNSFLGTSFVVRSIPRVTSKGVETEMQWQTGVEGLSFQGGVTYADTRYGKDTLPDEGLVLLPGSRISFAPLWSASAALRYERKLGRSLLGSFHLGAKYMSEFNTGSDLDPQKAQSAVTVVNARVGIGAVDKAWQVELWARNLTDAEYIQVGFDAPLQAGAWNAFLMPPRTYGVTLRLQY